MRRGRARCAWLAGVMYSGDHEDGIDESFQSALDDA
jgi:hypothetical protein